MNSKSKNIMYELLERPLNIGDLVFELSDYTYEKSYGIVVSTKEIYTLRGIVKPKKVYKVENPVNREIEIRNKVLESYTIYQAENMRKQAIAGKYDRGDIVCRYKSSYNYYLCLGKVKALLYSINGKQLLEKDGIGYLYITSYHSKNIPDFSSIDLEELFSNIRIGTDWDGKSFDLFILNKKSDTYLPVDKYNIIINDIYVDSIAKLNIKLL